MPVIYNYRILSPISISSPFATVDLMVDSSMLIRFVYKTFVLIISCPDFLKKVHELETPYVVSMAHSCIDLQLFCLALPGAVYACMVIHVYVNKSELTGIYMYCVYNYDILLCLTSAGVDASLLIPARAICSSSVFCFAFIS